jgi:hypothetical protein
MESRSERCSVAEAPITNPLEGRRIQAMKKALTITLVAALALVGAGTAYANYCARDYVPASTILVPFARQAWDWDAGTYGSADDEGYRTLLHITNVSEDAQIIHIVVWNMESEGVLDFDEVLSGYDVWSINSYDMLTNNAAAFKTSLKSSWKANINFPPLLRRYPFAWGPDGPTAFDGNPIISNPEYTYNVDSTANCFVEYNNFPAYNFNLLVKDLAAPMFDRDHAGCEAAGGRSLVIREKYASDTWTKEIETIDELWYYMTIDVVRRCSLDFPVTGTYFTNTYAYRNVLLGEVVYLNSTDNFSDVNMAIHIEGEPDPQPQTNNQVYFYDEKSPVDPNTGLEPLSTAIAFQYRNTANIKTNLLLWKNHKEFNIDEDVDDCGSYLYYAWDQDEHTLSRVEAGCEVSPCEEIDSYDPNEFPFETQLVPIDTANFDLPAELGWMLIVFQPSYPPPYWPASYWWDGMFEDPTPPETGLAGVYYDMMVAAYAQYIYDGYSGILEVAEMSNYHCDIDQRLPGLNTTSFITE